MKWFKSVIFIALQNFRKWRYDCRIWIALIMVLIFIHSTTKGLSDICSYTGVQSAPWIFPFLYMPFYSKMLFFFPLVLIFSNAPFVDKNQLYVLIRAGKSKWCIGQTLYIIAASALYFIFIMAFSIVLNFDCIEFTGEWGKLLNTLANTDMNFKFQLDFDVEKDVINMFTPMGAMWFTFLHSWISGVILGFAMFLFNMKIRGGGTLLASFMVVFSAVAAKNISLTKMSPVSWSTLNYIQLQNNDRLPSYGYVATSYAVLLFVLFLMILLSIKKYNFDQEIKK
ncbi:MAG: hypothetical protein IJD58_02075 [Lachnospiraceae bacterium]|nr:hypothetical protein [Lachnospiraceae bacterium]